MGKKRGYISLFSGAGVGCSGFSREDFDCVATAEIIQRRLDVQKANTVCSLESGYIAGDMKDPMVVSRLFTAINEWKSQYRQKEIDVVVATPPCQGISVANHKKKNELVRNSLVVESIELIHTVQPRYFVLENVRGFLRTICTDTDGADKPVNDAIYLNLAGSYNIASRVINFKDYGNNSSRTRTLVIGVRKDIEEITPYDLFPLQKSAPTLRTLISDLKSLDDMGAIDPDDIYHSFRPYQLHMMEWIKATPAGASAFDNSDPSKRPHRIIDGKVVENQNKNGDKYRRCQWDKVAPCVHTRNDILASQATIHPVDNRVFSIRELMRFMTIPNSFKWTDISLTELNSLSDIEKRAYLKKHGMNIRQCIGEAVPTAVFQQIAQNIVSSESAKTISVPAVRKLISELGLASKPKLQAYISDPAIGFVQAMKVAELANAKRLDDSAYYTRQDLCFSLVHDLPDFRHKKTLKILEPSVGVGNFLPSIFHKYAHIENVELDLCDINRESFEILKTILRKRRVPANFKIRYIHDDFLLHKFSDKYDLVIGNPPFKKLGTDQTAAYRSEYADILKSTNNIFALFISKSLAVGNTAALFTPKSLLSAPEFDATRKLLAGRNLRKIVDYGEKGFRGVKIETISFQAGNSASNGITVIESYPLARYKTVPQSYIADSGFPYWLIYRDTFFDSMSGKLQLGSFKVIRDRSLTTKAMLSKGKYRVIKARNIRNGYIQHTDKDQFVDSIDTIPASRHYFNQRVIVAPNLSYYPRASLLPKGSIVDGSAAVLVPHGNQKITVKDLDFFASKEYFSFYRIARNYSTRSLNIDSSSVYFWGMPKESLEYKIFDETNRSRFLFARPEELLMPALELISIPR